MKERATTISANNLTAPLLQESRYGLAIEACDPVVRFGSPTVQAWQNKRSQAMPAHRPGARADLRARSNDARRGGTIRTASELTARDRDELTEESAVGEKSPTKENAKARQVTEGEAL